MSRYINYTMNLENIFLLIYCNGWSIFFFDKNNDYLVLIIINKYELLINIVSELMHDNCELMCLINLINYDIMGNIGSSQKQHGLVVPKPTWICDQLYSQCLFYNIYQYITTII
jgi:hypothetical protein